MLITSMNNFELLQALVASDCPIDSHVPNELTVEAPLPINIPMSKVPSDGSLPTNAMQGKNIIIPVSVKTDPPGEKRPNVKSGTQPPRRKRKDWSTEDDLKLTAAVEKHGEQNWDCIAGGDFKNDMTPVELSLVLQSPVFWSCYEFAFFFFLIIKEIVVGWFTFSSIV